MSSDDSLCTPEEQIQSNSNNAAVYCLSRGQSIGLTVTAESGIISLVAILIVFVLIFRNVIRNARLSRKWDVIRAPTDAYLVCLFVFDLIQAVSTMMDVYWVNAGKVSIGKYCSAQGALQQLGETGVAMATLVIAVHTFVAIWWRKRTRELIVAYSVIALIWLFVTIFVVIGFTTVPKADGPYMTPTPYWCWIGSHFLGERIGGQYLWYWITLCVSMLLYILIFLWSRGNIVLDENSTRKWHFYWRPRKADADGPRSRPFTTILIYPLAYSINVLPLSIVRWITFVRGPTSLPSAATFAVISIYGLGGFVNVLLFLFTRPELLLFRKIEPAADYGSPPPLMSTTDFSETTHWQ